MNDKLQYRLRCQILAHTNDVRTICVMENAIISGSRDMSLKLWTENRGLYENSATLKAHSNYISSVCILPQTKNLPNGLIVSGGHDHNIFGFIPYTEDPILCLQGHSGPVCCLSQSIIDDCLLSSSWDCSAKLWNVVKQQCLFTIYGHTQTIWAVIHIPFDYVITGSADKNIKVFNSDGNFMNTLSGHTDCVRGLAHLHENIIASCGNDGTVRTWNVRDGTCLDVQYLHSNYIYSIKAAYDRNIIVAGCEDKILSVIYKGSQKNIITPAQSIWAVGILPNCDIVTGSSDGYIRIFTTSSSRQASSDELELFEKQLTAPTQPISDQTVPLHPVKNLKKTDKGEFNDQLKFIKVFGIIKCFKWSTNDSNWFPLEESTQLKTMKCYYDGKGYDDVFNIDVEGDYENPLKLPYNIRDDPLLTAECFIRKYNINPKFTGIIFDFLTKKSEKAKFNGVMETEEVASEMVQVFYPPSSFIFFQRFEETICKQRLHEFWGKQSQNSDYLSLEYLKSLTFSNEVLVEDSITFGIKQLIKCINTWPENMVYPVLDIARISILRPMVNSVMFNKGFAEKLWNSIEKYMEEGSNFSNKMFVCRILCNMFTTEEGINFIFEKKELLFSRFPMSSFSERHRGYEIALSSLLLNLSLEATKRKDNLAIYVCLDIVQNLLKLITEEEAVFRVLVALGTLSLTLGHNQKVYTKEVYKMLKTITTWKNKSDDSSIKASMCAKGLLANYVSLILRSNSKTEDEKEDMLTD